MTPPQEALVALASEPATSVTFDDLNLKPADIFDRAAVWADLTREIDAVGPDAKAIRKVTVDILRAAIADGRSVIAGAFGNRPLAARPTVKAYNFLTDGVVEATFRVATNHLHPNPNPTEGERLSVIAVGGYGRGEMAPHSDVDLLFLMPYKVTPWAESLIESMLYVFWDLHLKVGHASRSIKDCLRLGREDYTIRTALLENRYLTGDSDLAKKLDAKLKSDLFKGTVSDFIEAKLEERSQRHRKQGGQRYMVEPNVKEGKGGLRDLQTLYWIGKYIHGVESARELVAFGLFSQDEYERFRAAETFLMAARCHLHLAADRPVDQLTFDMQVEVAERMGYADKTGRRAVEHFMQDYFRHATAVGEVTRIFLTVLEANHVKQAPSLVSFFQRKRKVKPDYVVKQNRLAVARPKTFLNDKLNLLRIFQEALRTGYLLHPDAMRLVTANLHLIDDEMRNAPEANRIFFDLLLKHGNPERALRRMNELDVLAAFVPEFAPVVAMMQFNMYHHYTVDEHTIQCISTLAQIEREELIEELPVASQVLKEGVNRKVLYAALFLHDIGKGRPEDHSVLGAQIARKVAPRFGLKPKEVETVEWLVRHHLLMSDIAQKRDLSEPRTVRGFAKAVKNREQLDLLLALTVCDIRGVGPGVWNNWKAQLLRDLYRMTRIALEEGVEAISRETVDKEAKKALRDALSDWPAKELRHETMRHYGPYWQGLTPDTQIVFAKLLRGIADDEIRMDLMPDEERDATRICFALVDHPGIFARLTGALALVGANVVDASTYTSSDGYATAVFWVQDVEGSPYEASRLPRLRGMIEKTLAGEVLPRESLADRDRIKKRERAFRVPTVVSFDNEGSDIYTVIEVDTRDRPGLLYDLARTLSESNVYIASAVIATYGEQVVDTFYVKDSFGLKFHSDAKQKTLEKRLRDAIEAGAARAKKA
ncbi:MAG: [protein-PII] uridylyltransferase [Silicimonas sp.]|nr:[protein-PII] uridylyltransferase [Silicimonas sp.]